MAKRMSEEELERKIAELTLKGDVENLSHLLQLARNYTGRGSSNMDAATANTVESKIGELSISDDPDAKEKIYRLLVVFGDEYAKRYQFTEAIETYKRALVVKPDCPDVHYYMAEVHFRSKNWSASGESCLAALKLCPTHTEALEHLALIRTIQDRNDTEEVEQLCLKAIQTSNDCSAAHRILAEIRKRSEKTQKRLATTQRRRAIDQIQLWKESDSLHSQTMLILMGITNISDLIRSIQTCLKSNPDGADTFADLNFCLQICCDWKDYESRMAKLSDLIDKQLQLNLHPLMDPFVATCFFPLSLSQQLGIATHFADLAIKRSSTPAIEYRLSGKRLRIGYVYTGSRTFPLMKLRSQHNAERVEIFFYCLVDDPVGIQSEMTRAIYELCRSDRRHYVDLTMCFGDSLDAANKIASDGIQILVVLHDYYYECNGLDAILSLRPAPVQVVYRSLLGSTGASYVDYIITDKVASPLRLAHGYTEKFAYMPNGMFINADSTVLTKQPGSLKEKSQLRKRFGLPESAVVYGVMSKSFSIDPATFQSWCEILRLVPGSVLLIFSDLDEVQTNLKREAKRHKINPHRLIFADDQLSFNVKDPIPIENLIDVVLDTSICNGVDLMELMCRGIPIVTLPRESLPSRLTASMLTSIGCEELIAKSQSEYIEMAVKFGNQHELLAQMKAKMREILPDSNLFRVDQYFNDLEVLFQKMWKLKEMGEKPEHIV